MSDLSAECQVALNSSDYADTHAWCRGSYLVQAGGYTAYERRCDCTCHQHATQKAARAGPVCGPGG